MKTTTGTSLWAGRSRWILGALIVVTAGVVAAAVVSRSGLRTGTIPAGTRIVAALQSTVSTEKSNVGDRVKLVTKSPIELAEGGSLPEGAVIQGEVTHSEGGGRIAGAPELTLRFTQLQAEGRVYNIIAEPFRVRGKSDAAESAAEIGGGAVVGGVVGAIAHKTVEGVVIGAVLGTGVAVATKGNQIVLPAGQRLRVTVVQPVTVSYKRSEK
ncbi:MAG TPA: hypothetical protein VGQ73_08050 [Gemmatimonadales bacterium]|jgi:hypothetical protein|nr:hypothetical protein [Gemmatimonadales bacterium]